MPNTEVRVEKSSGEEDDWLISQAGKVVDSTRTKQSAEKKARRRAKKVSPSNLVIENSDGKISYQQFYEN